MLRRGGSPLEIEALELAGPRPDEVLVRVVASGICHTDIGFCKGKKPSTPSPHPFLSNRKLKVR